ncbi:MAG: hypothetical protein AAF840_01910 [Bacteroidota bacterium]
MGLFSNKFRVSTQAITANTQFGAFGVVMRGLNAGLTFGFGYAFGAATFDTGSAQLSAILGGVAYMVILDVAAFGWEAASRRQGISPQQRAIADGMSSTAMWSSTVISGVQLLLTTTLVTVSPSMRESIGMLALILITSLLAAHFVRLFAYYRLSPEAVQSRIDAELQATLGAMAQRAKQEQAEMIAEQVADYLTEHTDKIVALESKKAFDHILIGMGHGDQVARPQVQGKDNNSSGGKTAASPKSEPEDAIIEDDPVAEQNPIDFEELTGNARAAQEQNLNMAGA